MEKINIYLIDMTNSSNTSGVDRYMSILVNGLKEYLSINIIWIRLRHDNKVLLQKEEKIQRNCIRKTISLPQFTDKIIEKKYWINKYNIQVFRLTKHLFKSNRNNIIHIHTLNLIDLALHIKSKIPCKIITHLHCIPWKGLFNNNIDIFNNLYKKVYSDKLKNINYKQFITNNSEKDSYFKADHLICVTNCAKVFLETIIKRESNNLSIIPNGISDLRSEKLKKQIKNSTELFKLIYVGVLSKSKGLNFILEAMEIVNNKGYNVELNIAGSYMPMKDKKIIEEFPDLKLKILGKISFDKLKKLYQKCDIGIIASLQEQASYVAVEMAMFGLPIITTAVDGLDETFTHNKNALKVNTLFSKLDGLTVDVEMMAKNIIKLIENEDLRKKISVNSRILYEKELNLEKMINSTVNIYKSLVDTKFINKTGDNKKETLKFKAV